MIRVASAGKAIVSSWIGAAARWKAFSELRNVGKVVSWSSMTLLIFAMLGIGCTRTGRQEPPLYPVAGTVVLDGKPLPEGTIFFITVSLGRTERVPIKDGTFSGKVAAGERRIEFSVIKDVPYSGPAMPGIPSPTTVPGETLPSAFNADSSYSATVTPEGPNEFDFELKSK